ncbi:unnamed protein product, partial [marine sediment metagenome]
MEKPTEFTENFSAGPIFLGSGKPRALKSGSA